MGAERGKQCNANRLFQLAPAGIGETLPLIALRGLFHHRRHKGRAIFSCCDLRYLALRFFPMSAQATAANDVAIAVVGWEEPGLATNDSQASRSGKISTSDVRMVDFYATDRLILAGRRCVVLF